MITTLISSIERKPKKIFILDGLGAILTAFLLGVVLMNLEDVFGIPKKTLRMLSIIPILYLVYDIFCYFLINKKIGWWLRGIAILNLLYCPISIGFALNDKTHIKRLGWVYISLEIMVIIIIALYEFRLANRLAKKEYNKKHFN